MQSLFIINEEGSHCVLSLPSVKKRFKIYESAALVAEESMVEDDCTRFPFMLDARRSSVSFDILGRSSVNENTQKIHPTPKHSLDERR